VRESAGIRLWDTLHPRAPSLATQFTS